MPKTMLNWVMATRRPRYLAGAISAMYMGETTEAPPTATPPMKRKVAKDHQPHAREQPIAETKYRAPNVNSTARRPKASAGRPTTMEPMIVPIRAVETVKPSMKLATSSTVKEAGKLERNCSATWAIKPCLSQSVVPEITAVSK